MNNLSWLLYFADVFNSAGEFLFLITIISAGVFITFTLFRFIEIAGIKNEQEYQENIRWFNMMKQFQTISAVVFVLSSVHVFIPSKETMYMIIASEFTEVVIADEATQQLLGDVQEIISLQLESLKPNSDSN